MSEVTAAPVEQTPSQRIAAQLRAAADYIEAHSTSAEPWFHNDELRISEYGYHDLEDALKYARALGGLWQKVAEGDMLALRKHVAPGVVHRIVLDRYAICERVVVGTVEKTVVGPDPDEVAKLPAVERKVTEEIVEWKCPESFIEKASAA